MKLALALVVVASTAHADGKLGFRFGGSRIPLAEEAVGALQFGLGIDHVAFGKTRIIAEYEYMWLTPGDSTEDKPPGQGHRTHLGLRRTFAEKRLEVFAFYADIEAGVGLGMYDVTSTPETLPHAFAGLRGGWRMGDYHPRAAKELETEWYFRALAVEHGLAFGGGIGFHWRD